MCGLGSESTVGFVILVILTKFGTGCNWRNFMSILHFKFKSISLSLTFSSLSRSMQDRDRAVPFKEHASCTQHRAMPCKDRAVACSSVQCRCSAGAVPCNTIQGPCSAVQVAHQKIYLNVQNPAQQQLPPLQIYNLPVGWGFCLLSVFDY